MEEEIKIPQEWKKFYNRKVIGDELVHHVGQRLRVFYTLIRTIF